MKIYLSIIVFFLIQSIYAQDYKFGKVSKEELQQTSDPDHPEANAAILYRNHIIHFDYIQGKGFIQENEIHERVKIYNKEGFEYATKLIKLYANTQGSKTYNEQISSIKAVTYNLNNGKIEEEKLKKEGVFEEQDNKFWKTTKFTMPNIKEGCVIEFQYTIRAQRIAIDDIELQQLIPIKKLDLKLKTPEYFLFKRLLNPRATYIPKIMDSKENGKILLTTKARSESIVTSTSFGSQNVEYQINVISADLTNIPPLKGESYVDNIGNYQSKLIMELDVIKFPGEPTEYLSTTWEKVTKTIYDDTDFGTQLEKKGYYNKEIDALLEGVSDAQQKATLIFNHVKSRVKWDGFHGYTAINGVSKAYKEGSGNAADINLMLISMLRYTGLNANPILVSTKNNGIPLLPTRSGFNYVICGLEIDNNFVLLDATNKFTTANILPIKTLNWLGRLIRKDQTSDWIQLIPTIISKEVTSLNIAINPDFSATGKVRNLFSNYQAFQMRETYKEYSNEQMIKQLEKDKGELEVSNFVLENMNDVSQNITQNYDFRFNNAVDEIGGKLYFSPMMFLVPNENPFKEDKRNYPIDFLYPIADRCMINIVLPEGYVVESMPKSSKFEFNGKDGTFTFVGVENGSMLQFNVSLDLNKVIILAEEYEQFKEFYQMMIEKKLEKVVLKKV